MSELSGRQVKLAKLIMQEKEFRPMQYFSQHLCVSDKTLFQDLKEIEKHFQIYGYALVRKTGKGIYLDEAASSDLSLLNSLEQSNRGNEDLSLNERRNLILTRLLMSPGVGVSIQKLSDEFIISRASIVNDLKSIEVWIEKHALVLKKNNTGRYIAGDETNIRLAIAALMNESRVQGNENDQLIYAYASRLDEATKGGLQKFFALEEINYIENILSHLETISGRVIREPYYINLLTHILICMDRIKKRKRVEYVEGAVDISTFKSFEYAQMLAEKIKLKFNLDIGEGEIYYIYKYLISSGIGIEETESKKQQVQEQDNLGNDIILDMTRCISKALHIDMTKNEYLAESLLLHIRPMLSRLEYNISVKSEILEDVYQNYGQLLGLCQGAMWCISQKYGLKEVTIDEISYIATYYQAMLESKQMRKRVLVVCHSGFGTSQLLTLKLKRSFSSWDIIKTLSARQLQREDLSDIDFVVSTVPIDGIHIPYIIVSAVLTEKDIQKIQNAVSINLEKMQFSVERLQQQLQSGWFSVCGLDAELQEKEWERKAGKIVELGSDIQVSLSIGTREETKIYKCKNQPNTLRILISAMNYDLLLNQISEVFQVVYSARGLETLRGCHKTEDLHQLFFGLEDAEQLQMDEEKERRALGLLDVLKEEVIDVSYMAKDFKDAVFHSGELLVKGGCVKMEYAHAMVDAVEKIGPYIVIAKGIALPHAETTDVVNDVGVSIVKLQEPVVSGHKENDPISLLIAFSTPNQTKHRQVIRELTQVISSDAFPLILEAETAKEAINTIRKIIKGECGSGY